MMTFIAVAALVPLAFMLWRTLKSIDAVERSLVNTMTILREHRQASAEERAEIRLAADEVRRTIRGSK